MKTIAELKADIQKIITTKFKEVQGRGLFRKHSKTYDWMVTISNSLDLKESMTTNELEHAIKIIEKLPLDSEQFTYFDQFITAHDNFRILSQVIHELPNYLAPLPVGKLHCKSHLTNLLIETHQALLNTYESRITYDEDMLNQSQAFLDLIRSTQEAALPDRSKIGVDIGRGINFHVDGTTILPLLNDEGEANIIQFIEDFAGDSVDIDGSKAAKILNFGGQFLHTIVLREFMNTVEFSNNREGPLTPNRFTKGYINWSKSSETNEIDVTVDIAIHSFTYGSEVGILLCDAPTKLKFLPISEFLEEVQEGDISPICQFKVNIKLELDRKEHHYFFRVKQCQLRINTSELTSATLNRHLKGHDNDNHLAPSASAAVD